MKALATHSPLPPLSTASCFTQPSWSSARIFLATALSKLIVASGALPNRHHPLNRQRNRHDRDLCFSPRWALLIVVNVHV
jgi:hypothetical protein